MKKIILISMIFVAANAFGQTIQNVPLNKEQEKKVKTIQKQAQSQLDAVVSNTQMKVEEKKAKVRAMKGERDAQLSDILTTEQYQTVMTKDPVKWEAAVKNIDKNESNRLKTEMQQQLDDISSQQKKLDSQMDDLKKQQKSLKDKEKAVKSQYK